MQPISRMMDTLLFLNQFSQGGNYKSTVLLSQLYSIPTKRNDIFRLFSAHDSPETIELEINTGSSEGLILWQGVVSQSPSLRPSGFNTGL